jgi:hypothetical protein
MRTEEEIKSDIESVNKCLNPLSLYSTKDIVTELISRDESTWMRVPIKYPHLSRCWSSAYDSEIATDDIGGVGPAIVIVVKEDEE